MTKSNPTPQPASWEARLKDAYYEGFPSYDYIDVKYEDIKGFISALLKEERTASYKEGVKDGETSTKNGVGRYQMGYNDGRNATLREVEIDVEKIRDLAHNGRDIYNLIIELQNKLTSVGMTDVDFYKERNAFPKLTSEL